MRFVVYTAIPVPEKSAFSVRMSQGSPRARGPLYQQRQKDCSLHLSLLFRV